MTLTQTTGYTWAIERNGVFVLAEYDLHGVHHSLRGAPEPPYRFHARSIGKCLFLDIEPGQEPIWEHRVCDSISVFNGKRLITDSVIFGRREPDGAQTVVRLYPDGDSPEFESLDAARAHMKSPA